MPVNDQTIFVALRNQSERVELKAGLDYRLYLVVSNESFLVPAQYVIVGLRWNRGQTPETPEVSIRVLDFGDYWRIDESPYYEDIDKE
jgi:hypothetical protein